MRIIAGALRGKRLSAPPGLHTRPTTDRVKEAVFSIIQFRVPGARVLDLFAGSGQLGLECLSRGAASCLLCDNDRAALRAIGAEHRVLRDAGSLRRFRGGLFVGCCETGPRAALTSSCSTRRTAGKYWKMRSGRSNGLTSSPPVV